ncbi:MAG: hypothetical protein ACJA1W_002255, partial [Akkermansiaceae bacterium]
FQRDIVDIDLVFFDEIEKQIKGALEDFQTDFVIGGFHGVRHIG